MQYYNIIILTSNKVATLTLEKPRLQSRQEYFQCIYDSINKLQPNSNTVAVVWARLSDDNEPSMAAEQEARKAT